MPTYLQSDIDTYTPANSQTRVRLTLLSESLSPDEISERLGLAADRSWRLGERRGRSRVNQRYHGWQLDSKLPADASTEEHLDELLSRLTPRARALQRLTADRGAVVSARLWISHHIDNWNPGIEILPRHLALIARLGVSLALDIYVYEPGSLGPTRQPRSIAPTSP